MSAFHITFEPRKPAKHSVIFSQNRRKTLRCVQTPFEFGTDGTDVVLPFLRQGNTRTSLIAWARYGRECLVVSPR